MTGRRPLDAAALLSALDEHRVAFVVAGSVAAMARGVPDIVPGDLDIVPDLGPVNLARLSRTLEAVGATPPIETGTWTTDELGERAWVEDGVERPPAALDPNDPDTFDHAFTTSAGTLDVVPALTGPYVELRGRADRLPVAGRRAWVADPVDVLAGMTRPRRVKDVPRVRHLRAQAAARRSGIGFIGFRTDRFEEMVALFRDRIGLAILREAPGATWFRLGTDAELHVYAHDEPDHAFFTTGPVVGLRVDDVDATRAALEADGLEMLTEVARTDAAAWCHVRAPDGTVFEIIGPAQAER